VRLKKEQIDRLAEKVIADLAEAKLVVFKKERTAVLETIKAVIRDDISKEEELEREAERLLEQTLRAAGGGMDIDRHKMLKMIKQRLAKERNIVL
jgi:hypothetical protein